MNKYTESILSISMRESWVGGWDGAAAGHILMWAHCKQTGDR